MATAQRNRRGGTRDLFAERYARKRDRLSPACRKVAAYIEANRVDVVTSSALDLARATGTSDATVVRAVQALGFDGLHDLRKALGASLGGRNAPADNMTRTWADVGESAEAAMENVLASIGSTLDTLREEPVRAAMLGALKILHVAQRIVVFGVGPTAHIAAYFAARLRRKGRVPLVIDRTGSSLADQLLELRRGDALLMLAYGKTYQEAEAVVLEARRLQLPIVLITDTPDEKPGRSANQVLAVPRGRADRVALHGGTVACLEMLLLGLATTGKESAAAALAELDRLRETTGLSRRRVRRAVEQDDEE